MKIVTLMVRHGTKKYPNALADLRAVCANFGPEVQNDIVVVDNALERGIRQQEDGHLILGGDNSRFEFSGWDAGLEQVDLHAYDGVLFVTEAFRFSHQDYLARFNRDTLELAVRHGAAIGHLDSTPEPVQLHYMTSRAWLRTAFFFLPMSVVHRLGKVSSPLREEDLFGHAPDAPFSANAPISRNLISYILGWLTGNGKRAAPDAKWHSEFVLNDETFDYFRKKTVAILNERMLTARLTALQVPVAHIQWLANVLETEAADFPWWSKSTDYQIVSLLCRGT